MRGEGRAFGLNVKQSNGVSPELSALSRALRKVKDMRAGHMLAYTTIPFSSFATHVLITLG